MLRLNLGSGQHKLQGYENIDLIHGTSAYPLQYESESVDEIRASHLLEHFGRHEVKAVLKNWIDKLRPGGILKIAVPSFDKIQHCINNNIKLPHPPDAYLFGGQKDGNDYHKSMFTDQSLSVLMQELGLKDIETWESEVNDCASLPISLNLRGRRPGGLEFKIQAVMSTPRLGFTANMACAFKAFPKLGIGYTLGTGVFWGQVLSRLIEKYRADGTEYIITCDYDTWFTENHVIRLLQLMAENPDVDAIVPVQIKRENELPMFAMIDEDNSERLQVPVSEFDSELVPIINGHFGLTIFRTSAFNDLKKPWFIAHPNEDGDWGEGRIDEDIHFWHNFHKCGRKVCLAPEINIGHLQLKCTFPGSPRNQFKPVEYYMNAMGSGDYAEHCVPKVELLK
jgi:hypothetical protein